MLKDVTDRLTGENEVQTDSESATADDPETDGGRVTSDVSKRVATDTENSVASDSATPDVAETVPEDGGPEIGLDQIFGVLKNRRRRGVLRSLAAKPGKVRLGELAERIAAQECDKEVSQIASQERKRVYVGLYQCHLPRMADVGAVTYNKSRGVIGRGPNFGLFEHYLPDEEGTLERQTKESNWLQSLIGK